MKILACLLFMCTIPPLIWCAKPDIDRSGPRVCVMGSGYCDPTWLPAPNLNRALTGIDIAKKQPMPYRPEADQSVKQIIFNAVTRNINLGNMEALNFIHLTDKLVCSQQFNITSWSTMEQYIRGSAASSMSSWGLSYEGPTVSAEVAVPGDVLSLEVSMPPNTAGFESGKSDSMANMEKFFSGERGSISHGEARCSLYTAEININDPSLSLNPSFVSALKNIDLAKTKHQKTYAMKKFINDFGSHYAKKTIMGIGAAFETRFTGEETQKNDEHKRNECNKQTGGFRIFGFGSKTVNNKCSSSLDVSNDRLTNNMKRFKSTTYGTPLPPQQSLEAWAALVSQMMMEDKLSPVPIQQELAHIIDLFATPAVSSIVHNDGSKINVGNLFKTALYGYRNYCTYTKCKLPGCAKTVLMKYGDGTAGVFKQQDGPYHNGRPTYISTDQENTSYLQFNEKGNWIRTRGSTQIGLLKTSACPQKGFVFQSISYVFFNGPLTFVYTWKECAGKCFERSDCKYWQHDTYRKECSLIADYGSVIPTAGDVTTGARDCRGDKSRFAYGLCLENMSSRSMWVENGRPFKKGAVVEAYDPSLLIVAGVDIFFHTNVDIFFKKQCTIRALPYKRSRGNLVVTAGQGKLLYCGGEDRDPEQYSEAVDACLDGRNDQTIKSVSLEECKQRCSSSTDCNSLDYLDTPNKWNNKYCYLSKDTKETQPSSYKEPCPGAYATAIHLEKNGQYSKAVDACLDGHNDLTLTSVSLEECKQRCSSSTDCKSIDYLDTPNKWNKKYCYLSKETKETQPSSYEKPCPGAYASTIHLEKKSNPGKSDRCWVWDPARHQWEGFHSLTTPRSAASSVTMPDGVYILGGQTKAMEATRSTEYLPIGHSNNWRAGPTLPQWASDISDMCAVKISETEFVIIGGTSLSINKVSSYNTVTKNWEHRTNLIEARDRHACAFHPPTKSYPKGYIIVTAGRASGELEDEWLTSTEIIPVDTWVSLVTSSPRSFHTLVTVGGRYPTVYAMGVDEMEEWDPEKEKWKLTPFKLNTAKRGISALAVPPIVACK